MKLVRYGNRGQERAGVIGGDSQLHDLSMLIQDFDVRHLSPEALHALSLLDVDRLPLVAGSPRLGCPVAEVGKIVCIGLNYADHARESGAEVPKEPILFMKATTSINGPADDVVIPRGSVKTDWEVELGVVIGSTARYVDSTHAMDHVAGYVLVNDISEREYQLERGGQWDKGKSCDTFSPIGPWLVTRDEIADPHNLRLWLDVNGRRVQDSSTEQLIFKLPALVSYISHFMTLEPGDVISTGTPAGVGLGQRPQPWYLKSGDVMRLGIEGLGTQQQICREWTPAG